MVKVSFLERPHSIRISEVDADGIWVDAGELSSAIQRVLAGVKHEAIPQEGRILERYPLLYIPLHQIQWLAAAR
jgi:hypothetical protein